MRKLYGKTRINGADCDDMNKKIVINLKYYKTKSMITKNNEKKYGIEIIKEEVNGANILREKSEVKYISDSEQVIESLLKILVKNKVTPIATEDIIADLSKNPEIIYNYK